MAEAKVKELMWEPIVNRNPVTLQVLGICSALAITNSLYSALIMSLALTASNRASLAKRGHGPLTRVIDPGRKAAYVRRRRSRLGEEGSHGRRPESCDAHWELGC